MKGLVLVAAGLIIFIFCSDGGQGGLLTKESLSSKLDTVPKGEEDQELMKIVSEFKKECTHDYSADTSFMFKADSIKLVFKYRCLMDSQLVIPNKYVSMYGFNEFVTHNYEALFTLYRNNVLILNRTITKQTFSSLIDSSLRSYGALLYPSVAVKGDGIEVHFSISIPLTDVGEGVVFLVRFDGGVEVKEA